MDSKALHHSQNVVKSQRTAADLATNPFKSVRSIYDIAIYIVRDLLGLDAALVVNLSIVLATLGTIGRYASSYLYAYAKSTCISSVRIHEDDALYNYVMRFMADKFLHTKSFRSVKAQVVKKTSIEDEEEAFKLISQDQASSSDVRLGGNDNKKRLISYRTMMGSNPIQFRPYQMSHIFIHKRNVFLFRHGLRSSPQKRGMMMRITGELTIECLGRSLDPIKRLLEEAQIYYLEKSISNTAIWRSSGPGWLNITSRPSREIDTVILEKKEKQMLLDDINEYLHPSTRRWYANHGIPYRRGYLFSGPPGTGKTSLTAALAGVFGLDIYVLTLLDPYMTEEQLIRLFSNVPSRCVVLLEDIDAAGLKRNDEIKRKKIAGEDVPGEAEVLKPGKVKKSELSISLSGLLNAIDGVASSEGRILVMTTNKPDELDSALIRPGRVDVHVRFNLPGKEEMKEMFLSMYSGLEKIVGASPSTKLYSEKAKAGRDDGKTEDVSSDEWELAELKESELYELAEKFGEQLPERKLSLAAVQGYLLRYKHDPRTAVEGARAWSEAELNTSSEKTGEKS